MKSEYEHYTTKIFFGQALQNIKIIHEKLPDIIFNIKQKLDVFS